MILDTLRSLFFRPPILQVAALCLRGDGAATEILLLRSLDSNRWLIPKGWPMRGKTLAEAAAVEAWEEAGVTGTLRPEAIGTYSYQKRRGSGVRQNCIVNVFELRVTSQSDLFPEAALRAPEWVSPETAARRVREPELRTLILRHAARNGTGRGGS